MNNKILIEKVIDGEKEIGQLKTDMEHNTSQLEEHLRKGCNDISRIPYDFDIRKFDFVNTKNEIIFPTGLDNTSVVHPCIVYTEEKWNGYNYWGVVNPYPSTNSYYENPHIVCSNDGLEWLLPNGISNPILPSPSNASNSDSVIFFGADGKMYCITRSYGNISRWLTLQKSSDGSNWETVCELYRSDVIDIASPSVIVENGRYFMFYVDLYDNNSNTKRIYKTEFYVDGTVLQETHTREYFDVPCVADNHKIWHIEVKKISSQFVVMYCTCPKTTSGFDADLFVATTIDFKNWKFNNEKLFNSEYHDDRQRKYYKSTFIPVISNGKMGIKLWYNVQYGSPKNWTVFYTEAYEIDNNEYVAFEDEVVDYGYLFLDNFNMDIDDYKGETIQFGEYKEKPTIARTENGCLKTIKGSLGMKFSSVFPINDGILSINIGELNYLNDLDFDLAFRASLDNAYYGGTFKMIKVDKDGYLSFLEQVDFVQISKIYFDKKLTSNSFIEIKMFGKYVYVCLNGELIFKFVDEYYDNNFSGFRISTSTNNDVSFDRVSYMNKNYNYFVSTQAKNLLKKTIDNVDTKILKANMKFKNYIFGDDFYRTNSSTLGTSSSGHDWNLMSGGFQIKNNQCVSSGLNNKSYININEAINGLEIGSIFTNNSCSIILRVNSATNDFIIIYLENKKLFFELFKNNNKTKTTVHNCPSVNSGINTIQIIDKNDEIIAVVNDTDVIKISETELMNNKSCGIRSYSANSTFDGFYVKKL